MVTPQLGEVLLQNGLRGGEGGRLSVPAPPISGEEVSLALLGRLLAPFRLALARGELGERVWEEAEVQLGECRASAVAGELL